MAGEDLLGAIFADPEDEAARLVYADWLDARGRHGQAELIRLQVDAAAMPAWDPRQVALRVRRRAIASAGTTESLLRALPGLSGVRWIAHDGVQPDAAVDTFGHLLEHQDALRRLGVRSLDVEAPRDRDAAARLAPIPGLRAVGLSAPRFVPEAIAWMADCPAMEGVTELRLRSPLDGQGVRALFGAPFAAGLETLSLLHASLGKAGWSALVDHDLPFLRRLRLQTDQLADDVTVLAAWPSLDGVERLDLAGSGGADQALAYLWGSPNLGHLRHLVLRANELGSFPADLGTSRIRLESLVLSDVEPGPGLMEQLVSASSTDTLRSLALGGFRWRADADALAQISTGPLLRRLQILRMAAEAPLADVVDAVAEGGPARLHTLELSGPRDRRRLGIEPILDGPSGRLLRAVAVRDGTGPAALPIASVERLLACPRLELLDVGIGTRPSASREALRAHPVVQRLVETGGLTGEAFGDVKQGRAA